MNYFHEIFPHSELLPSIYETEIVVTKKFVDKTWGFLHRISYESFAVKNPTSCIV